MTNKEEYTIKSLLGPSFLLEKIGMINTERYEPLLPETMPTNDDFVLPTISGFFTKEPAAQHTMSDFYPEVRHDWATKTKEDSINEKVIKWINKNRDSARLILIGALCAGSFLFGYLLK